MVYRTERTVAVSSQSLLRAEGGVVSMLKAARQWKIEDYVARARDAGASLLYEPLRHLFGRLLISPAREQVEVGAIQAQDRASISMIAEQARSEVRITDYLGPSIFFQAFYALLQEGRFFTVDQLVAMQATLSGTDTMPIPVRVYEDRLADGITASAVNDARLQEKIYVPNPAILRRAAIVTAQESDLSSRASQIADAVANEAAQYDVAGIELNALTLLSLFGDEPDLLKIVSAALFRAVNQRDRSLALVQSLAVQPGRIDLPGAQPLKAMDPILRVAAENSFVGTVVYSPGDRKIAAGVGHISHILSIPRS